MKAKYTITLNDLISEGFNLFDFDYNLYPYNSDKDNFQNMFIEYYRFNEIGLETPHLFKLYFKSTFLVNIKRLNEELEIFSKPFSGGKLTKVYNDNKEIIINKTNTNTRTIDGTDNINMNLNSDSNQTNKDDYLDTPETAITENNYYTNIRNINTNNVYNEESTNSKTYEKNDKLTINEDITNNENNDGEYTINQIYDYSKQLNDFYNTKDIYINFFEKFRELFMGVF